MQARVEGRPIDLGYYINADDINKALILKGFSFSKFRIKIKEEQLIEFARTSGLLDQEFNVEQFKSACSINVNKIEIVNNRNSDRVAQIIARFLREEMLRLRRRFSFETVFSHESNLDIMRNAQAAGYKVYLYFVSTESPEINKYRVQLRVLEKGHDVPEDKIFFRYYRSLNLLYEAAQISYQAFFFDNSQDNEPLRLVAHFKRQNNEMVWDKIPKKNKSAWFKKYYTDKVRK
jgi:predicted ABC-type ATPase